MQYRRQDKGNDQTAQFVSKEWSTVCSDDLRRRPQDSENRHGGHRPHNPPLPRIQALFLLHRLSCGAVFFFFLNNAWSIKVILSSISVASYFLVQMEKRMPLIKHKILVLSGTLRFLSYFFFLTNPEFVAGKGGVGKSTVASQLALTLSRAGKKVRKVFFFFNYDFL